jgi:Transposase IS116/IS110/IS902 family
VKADSPQVVLRDRSQVIDGEEPVHGPTPSPLLAVPALQRLSEPNRSTGCNRNCANAGGVRLDGCRPAVAVPVQDERSIVPVATSPDVIAGDDLDVPEQAHSRSRRTDNVPISAVPMLDERPRLRRAADGANCPGVVGRSRSDALQGPSPSGRTPSATRIFSGTGEIQQPGAGCTDWPYSVSARAMLEALLAGVSDPNELAELARGPLRAKIPRLREALANRFDIGHHGVLVSQLLAHIDARDQAIAILDERIVLATAPYAELIELLSTIPGVKRRTAEVLLAECGTDMSVFPTVGHFASWARICPGNNKSAGKNYSGKTLRGSRWLREALTEAAKAAARAKGTYLASHYWQIRGRRGEPKAIGATRHDILVAYYHIVRDRLPYRELGADWLARRYSPEHRARRLLHQLEALGLKVAVETA